MFAWPYYFEVFAAFNEDAADDPEGAGTAPGADFAVPGLSALSSDADGMVGKIIFPTIAGELREDVTDAALGMPRDLNGDGVTDSADHSGDFVLVPVRIRLEWRGSAGPRDMEFHTLLADR